MAPGLELAHPRRPDAALQRSRRTGRGGGKIATTLATDEQRRLEKAFSQSIPGGSHRRRLRFLLRYRRPQLAPVLLHRKRTAPWHPHRTPPAGSPSPPAGQPPGPGSHDPNRYFPLGNQAVQFIAESTRNQQPFLLYLPLTASAHPIAPLERWKGKSSVGPYGDFVMQTDNFVGRILETQINRCREKHVRCFHKR
ncbi:MAG: sulfatase-like hydrolase/transferase [Planctomycetales bacterium]